MSCLTGVAADEKVPNSKVKPSEEKPNFELEKTSSLTNKKGANSRADKTLPQTMTGKSQGNQKKNYKKTKVLPRKKIHSATSNLVSKQGAGTEERPRQEEDIFTRGLGEDNHNE